jgi:hypothetical protein
VLLRRFAAWLRRHWYGSHQIAGASRGVEVIAAKGWASLPEHEREEWEPIDEPPLLYRRTL